MLDEYCPGGHSGVADLFAAEKPPAEITTPGDEAARLLVAGFEKQEFDTWQAFRLSYQGELLAARPGFSEMLSLEHLRDRWRKAGVVPYRHQIDVLRRVVGPMRGRAILADEVGLGKTIEAGLVLTEYILRGLVKRVLILTPASLCRQWIYEMQDKFGLHFMPARGPEDWRHYNYVIASLDSAKRLENAAALAGVDFDMLIVDEAHKLKNDSTRNYQLVSSIRKRYFLLLTATPLQNNLKELFNLITLLRPGQLGSYTSFKRQFVENNRSPRNVGGLRQLLGEVVVRNRRNSTSVAFTDRQVEHIQVDLSDLERQLYDAIEEFIRHDFRRAGILGPNMLALITLQREICSSSFAAAITLCKMMQESSADRQAELYTLVQMASAIKENAKMRAVEELMARDDEKVIIFTEFIATQRYIMSRLSRAGHNSLAFDGHCSTSRKEWVKSLFREHPAVKALVSTETGGEGINLQFCRTLINYDLPWNPMRIEQRIGRIHRLGQTRDVRIFNLFTRDTVEEHILRLLAEKIDLFQAVVGDLDRILDFLGKRSMEQKVLEAVLAGPEQTARKLNELGDEIAGVLRRPEEDEQSQSLDRLLFS